MRSRFRFRRRRRTHISGSAGPLTSAPNARRGLQSARRLQTRCGSPQQQPPGVVFLWHSLYDCRPAPFLALVTSEFFGFENQLRAAGRCLVLLWGSWLRLLGAGGEATARGGRRRATVSQLPRTCWLLPPPRPSASPSGTTCSPPHRAAAQGGAALPAHMQQGRGGRGGGRLLRAPGGVAPAWWVAEVLPGGGEPKHRRSHTRLHTAPLLCSRCCCRLVSHANRRLLPATGKRACGGSGAGDAVQLQRLSERAPHHRPPGRPTCSKTTSAGFSRATMWSESCSQLGATSTASRSSRRSTPGRGFRRRTRTWRVRGNVHEPRPPGPCLRTCLKILVGAQSRSANVDSSCCAGPVLTGEWGQPTRGKWGRQAHCAPRSFHLI